MNVAGTTSKSSASSKGLSGLASGIDTESMVEQMLANAQSKIDKQSGIKQQTIWKQEMYRNIISSINVFQNKYFSSTSSSNLLSNAFFNAMAAVTSSGAFSVTANSSANTGSTKIEVDRLASSTKLTSGREVSGVLSGELNATAIQDMVDSDLAKDRTVAFTVSGTTVVVDLKDIFVGGGSYTTTTDAQKSAQITERINDAFKNAGFEKITAQINGGSMVITNGDDSRSVSVSRDSSAGGLETLGLTAGTIATALGGANNKLKSTVKLNDSLSFEVTLDDNKKTISLNYKNIIDGSGNVDLTKVKSELTTVLNKAHGNGQINVLSTGNKIELQVGSGRKILVGGTKETLKAFGLKNGQSNKIGVGGKLSELYFDTKLQGSSYKFTINGVGFEFDENTVMNDVITAINQSDAGVRLVYKSTDDKFVLESSQQGAGIDIELEQTEGNLLNAMFGSGVAGALKSGAGVSSKTLVRSSISPTVQVLTSGEFTMKSGTFNINVNGTAYKLNVKEKSDKTAYTEAELTAEVNRLLDIEFGEGEIKIESSGVLSVKSGQVVKFTGTASSSDLAKAKELANGGDLALAFGFALNEGTDNIAKETDTLADLGFGPVGGFAANTQLKDLGGALAFKDGKITFTGSGAGITIASAADMQSLFGVASLNLDTAGGLSASVLDAGENARVKLDGIWTERSSNTFNLNGLTIDLKGVTTGEETIEVTRNIDSIVDGIKSFIEDYNTLIADLNSKIREETNYKDYPPLTDAQKKEMTANEITLWEEKAKQGLLYNDNTISSLLSELRSVLYMKPDGCEYAIYDIGIETSSAWEDNGKLVMSADGEARLRQVLESNAEEVAKLFAGGEDSIGTKFNNVLTKTANLSSANPGTLVQIAGVKDRASDTDNDIYYRLKTLDEKIEALKKSYEREKSRYWTQFNAMEEMISKLNSQSEWLYSQFS